MHLRSDPSFHGTPCEFNHRMEDPALLLSRWKASLPIGVSIGGALAKNPTAYKWKAPYRSLVLREALFWRTYDLLSQAQLLHEQHHTLGSRLLLRSALESVAMLAYLNQCTAALLDGQSRFDEFEEKTRLLLLGSRDKSTKYQSVNVLTVLKHIDKVYPGVMGVYNGLSESAHPNFESVCLGYSEVNHESHETLFQVKHWEMWSDRHNPLFALIAGVFEHEYNIVWVPQQELLENWLTSNSKNLEPDRCDEISPSRLEKKKAAGAASR